MIAALAARYQLGSDAVRALERLSAIVAADDSAPTTVRDPAGIARDHLADSLVALELEVVRSARTIADIGAGAGFPGLPLAIALSEATVHLVESNGRKCAFMESAARACDVDNVHVVHARAEEWVDGSEGCDVVTARALAPLAVVAEYAAPLLCLGGALVAWRGRRDAEDEAAGARAAAELALEAEEPRRVNPYPGALHRHLHVLVKTGPTPARFPRRPGVARRRPLGGAPARSSDREQR